MSTLKQMHLVRSKQAFRFLPLVALWSLTLFACENASNSPSPNPEESTPAASTTAQESLPADEEVVLFLGNSLSAGNGLNPDQAFPALIQEKADSLDWPVHVINAGNSGETSAGGLRRVDWLLRQPIDVLVLELGGNDGLRGLSVADMQNNLQAIIDRTLDANPEADIVIAGMQSPPNMGADYTDAFRRVFPELAETNEATLIPFLLEGVAGIPELNQNDGIHPTAEGHQIVAQTVWTYLRPVLEQRLNLES